MLEILWSAAKVILTFFTILMVIAGLLIANAAVRWLLTFNDTVTLPNGMIAKRQFDFSSMGRHDIFASDGMTVVVRDVEFVCFNDRYIEVYTFGPGSGYYDAQTNSKVPAAYQEPWKITGLSDGHTSCNGYYTGMIGPSLLYDGMKSPFLPSCAWRNFDNPDLKDRDWFSRPCHPDDDW